MQLHDIKSQHISNQSGISYRNCKLHDWFLATLGGNGLRGKDPRSMQVVRKIAFSEIFRIFQIKFVLEYTLVTLEAIKELFQ